VSWRAWAAFTALCIIWGVPYFFIKLAVQEVSPFMLAWARITLAAGILLPIAVRRGALRATRGFWGPIALFALVEFIVPFSAISIGEQWISSSVAAILLATVPLMIAVLSRFFGVHERFGLLRSTGLMLGFIGVIALVGLGRIAGLQGWLGVGCMMLAAIGYAIGPLIIQRHLSRLDSTGATAGSLLIASLVLLVPACLSWPAHLPSVTTLSSIATLGVLCTATAMLLMFYLVNHAGAARASVITYVNPVVATLLGTLQLHERLGISGAIAFALILIGCLLATRTAHGSLSESSA
jgi:drug/metabolite transporter (DMT)-like permease